MADVEHQASLEIEEKEFDYSKRSQWLRAAVLGATDGLISIACIMMGVGSANKKDHKAMIISGFAGLVAGACSMAIGEFVSVYSQLDIERAQMKRVVNAEETNQETDKEHLPNPLQAALASALAFCIGAMLPLLAAAGFTREGTYKVMLGVVAGSSALGLLAFGAIGAVLGNAPLMKSCLRVLIGGCLAMAITIGSTKGFDKLTKKFTSGSG